MPIRPEMRGRYPANWADIAERAKRRAGYRCERCFVRQYAIGWRDDDGTFIETGDDGVIPEGRGKLRIVLTAAHLFDASPENCDDANIGSLCDRCHNIHDARMRGAHASATRRRYKAMRDLFDGQ